MRILIITRYFAPEITGGARRPKALADALTDLGHEVKIAAPLGADFSQLIGVPHPRYPVNFNTNSTNNKSAMDGLRKAVLLPDPEIRWALRLVRFAKNDGFTPDLVISTSPPESLHIAGALLKRHFKCKWIAEFRDPWIYPPQRLELLNPIRCAIERIIAKSALKNSDAIVGVSKTVLKDAKSLAPNSSEAIVGHFAKKFEGEVEILPTDAFNIVHTGAISMSNPLSQFTPFLCAFEEFCIARPNAHLHWAGRLSQYEIAAIEASPAKSNISLLGSVDYKRSRSLQLAADALLLVSGEKSHALPGKFSEYALTGIPIIAFGDGKWRNLIPAEANIIDFEAAKRLSKGKRKISPSFDARQAALDYQKLIAKLFCDKN